MQIALAEAMALLGAPANYTKDDVIAAFRREVKKAHPDLGGTAEMFGRLVKAPDRLLAALGTNAPAPKPPRYAPKGVQTALWQQSSWRRGPPRLDPPSAGDVITLKEARHDDSEEATLMATRDRWVLVDENGDLWLLKREGPEVRGRIVSREGLRREFPRLYAELIASNNKDTPRVVVER